ncbi:MAG TPA: GNAT family N-acetyltransferase [Acidimicrobiia bacterium]
MDHLRRNLAIFALTPERWPDLEQLFGERGASSGCWCMWWRVAARDWEQGAGAGNRAAFRRVVDSGPAPGLLAYEDAAPVGWVAVAPRAEYPRLNRSPKLKAVDATPVWAATCFYIDRHARGGGVAGSLLAAAVEHARAGGAAAIEGYPIDPAGGTVSNASAYTGVLDMFRAAGFEEIERRGGRPILRLTL